MKTKLITALRTAATALENGTFAYDWELPESCNCGIIASTLMHVSIDSLKGILPDYGPQEGSWKCMVGRYCPVTGLSENIVIRAMQESGMSQLDMVELENLSSPEVLKRMNLKERKIITKITGYRTSIIQIPKARTFIQWLRRQPMQFTPETIQRPIEHSEWAEVQLPANRKSKSHAIAYMRAWADLLQEEGKDDIAIADKKEVNA